MSCNTLYFMHICFVVTILGKCLEAKWTVAWLYKFVLRIVQTRLSVDFLTSDEDLFVVLKDQILLAKCCMEKTLYTCLIMGTVTVQNSKPFLLSWCKMEKFITAFYLWLYWLCNCTTQNSMASPWMLRNLQRHWNFEYCYSQK